VAGGYGRHLARAHRLQLQGQLQIGEAPTAFPFKPEGFGALSVTARANGL